MKNDRVDIAIIGGGIHGAGVAQAAAAAGYSVTLLEKNALASGTSSKSSKLIHGGLRYLESLDIRLVRESLKERELLIKNAPELVQWQAFFIPVYRDTSRRPWFIRSGLALYTLLSGFSEHGRFRSVPESEWQQLDGLKTDGLQNVFQYWDAQTDDYLLTKAVMASAQALGAKLLCPAEFIQANKNVTGYQLQYRDNQETHQLDADVVINAAGAWARSIAEKFIPALPVIPVENIQGTHIELPGSLVRGCYYLEVPEDQRAVFAIPWKGHTLFGTTEHQFTQDPEQVQPLEQELDYLLKVFRHYFPHNDNKIINAWAGLRVLPAVDGTSFKSSRETHLITDKTKHPAALSIFGGKLTAYRATAEKVMNIVQKSLPEREPKADTATTKLRPVNSI